MSDSLPSTNGPDTSPAAQQAKLIELAFMVAHPESQREDFLGRPITPSMVLHDDASWSQLTHIHLRAMAGFNRLDGSIHLSPRV